MFREELQKLRKSGLYRELRRIDSPQGPRVTLRGKEVILLASNNYLGLANHPQIIESAQQAMLQFGVGAGASRLISGNMSLHDRLEEAIAWLKGTETALLFNTGYMANTGILTALVGPGDAVYCDRFCHASILDGVLLARARLFRFRHNDMDHLQDLLSKGRPFKRRLIVTEGVFSMDGDIAPLPALKEISHRFETLLLVDDAHATGVLGKTGRGTTEHFGLEAPFPLLMGTFGKALGTFGAFVAGDLEMKRYLINTARSFIYTTALPIPVLAASFAAIRILSRSPHLLENLWTNRNYLHAGLTALGFDTMKSQTPIIPIRVGGPEQAVRFSERLMDEGIFAPAIRPPTVPKGTSRIRITVMSTHTREDLDHCLASFKKVGEEFRLI
jgi:8-amino-7-oxononanoate synthase